MMTKISCRIITSEFSTVVKDEVVSFFEKLDVSDLSFSDFEPYYKMDGYGEMNCTFFVGKKSLSLVQSQIADDWQSGTADIRRSRIYCPYVSFIWMTEI